MNRDGTRPSPAQCLHKYTVSSKQCENVLSNHNKVGLFVVLSFCQGSVQYEELHPTCWGIYLNHRRGDLLAWGIIWHTSILAIYHIYEVPGRGHIWPVTCRARICICIKFITDVRIISTLCHRKEMIYREALQPTHTNHWTKHNNGPDQMSLAI